MRGSLELMQLHAIARLCRSELLPGLRSGRRHISKQDIAANGVEAHCGNRRIAQPDDGLRLLFAGGYVNALQQVVLPVERGVGRHTLGRRQLQEQSGAGHEVRRWIAIEGIRIRDARGSGSGNCRGSRPWPSLIQQEYRPGTRFRAESVAGQNSSCCRSAQRWSTKLCGSRCC